ncbi:FAD-binding oxidoreductase [Deinococcus metallilatus]|uniref:FAD-dependent oxidoreductase n=1 Tax=Deinococcus metallilatus TaxID=1211322 RepID=A0AAJ5F3I8_9DEIO|nr:FAD-dependent oxidoreductase [Deinococcus metallilatus]MBB5296360.1 glycine/D-amino acid oxidase-like deaminating enzyme [Deinococcus metallilatus]QBY09962.1 FAD-binding oxidoreductase [Deinococcus metallilatus]RXJ08686.1 FAD-binding oxidoreductase [Deinococcus metallilatus]TLK25160.1 FAD-dependent oxidoreductase [Deinococcus metallilatus]GMA14726.1 oxidoreductase [Deinococcus metallilatus]
MDLRSGTAFWPLKNGLMHTYPPLLADERADVLVIGAGITGALLADALTGAGLDVVVLDRRDAAFGSTSASTALLQYEIDTNLVDLTRMIGQHDAERAYQLCREAIDQIGALTRELPDDCGFARPGSLYYASNPEDARMLREEHAARTRAGLEVEFLGAEEVKERFGLTAPAALFSPAGAEVDPYRLAQHLLWRAQARGARIHDRTEVTHLDESASGYTAHTSRAARVQARYVIVAAGYEAERFAGRRLAQLKDTYALVTEPLAGGQQPWPTGCLIWETARPYLYARTTSDGRILIGGEDDDHDNPARRERVLPDKQRRLEGRLEQLFPYLKTEVAFAWAGTFGETQDGLAFIGPKPGSPCLLFALGYGGNGITYSVQAARMLTEHILGRAVPDMRIFRLDR